MSRSRHRFDLPFPSQGLHKTQAFEGQPELTSCDLQNVRSFDPTTGRNRGAQRAGLSKYVNDRTADGQVQDMGYVAARATPSGQTEVGSRTIKAYAVTNGTVAEVSSSSFTTATSGSSALSATVPVIFSTELFGVVYFADGTNEKKWTASTNTVSNWVATSGTLPVDGGNRPRLITTWRSRIVVSGISTDPHNWFMSRVGDPLDWDYVPVPDDVAQAVAGNNAEAGKSADIINGLIPYNDDILLILGDHTVHQVTGDPAEGGRIDRISDQIGGAWGQAWCKDPNGNVYFFGSRGGVYRMQPGSPPQSMTSGIIEEDLAGVDLDNNLISMEWDDRQKGFYLFITPLDNTATTHYFYDSRNDAWFPDVFATNDHNPTSTILFDGDAVADRALWLGGQDGYIRKVDVAADDDDGVAIDAFVFLGPMQMEGKPRLIINNMEPILGESSDPITFDVYSSKSAEAAKASTSSLTGTWEASRNFSERRRDHGQSIYVRLRNNTLDQDFQFEKLIVTVDAVKGPGARWHD